MPKSAYLILVFLLLFQILIRPAHAVISDCSVSLDTTSIAGGASSSFNFSISNNSPDTNVLWIKITAPSSSFTINSVDGGIWSGSNTSQDATFTGAGIAHGSSTSIAVSASVADATASSSNWTVQVSDDSGGSNLTGCTGTLGTEITQSVPASPSAPVISGISVSNVDSSSVTVHWTTDTSSNSTVDYGTDSNYGTSASDANNVTSHTINLSGLSANTTYHYDVKSSDSSGSTTASGDNTFVTAKSGASGTTQTGTSTTTTTATTTTKKAAVDLTPPVVSVANDFSKPFKTAPLIVGRASDNISVSKVEYSIDDGKNWLPVDTIDNPGAKTTSFSFTPIIFEDGNYKLKARARDSSGNVGISGVNILIIDRLPPQIGGVLYSIGAQLLVPDKNGVAFTFPNMEQKITLSAVGGPVTIDISTNTQVYSLVKNTDNGLWSGALSFTSPGVYELVAKAVDGAGNRTERKLNTVVVLDSGKITSNSSPVNSGSVTLWYFDNETQGFVLWDGKAYGQSNPAQITKNGEYGFFVPAGKYYLEVKSPGFKTLRTAIFTLDASTPITAALKMEKSLGFQIGPFMFFLPDLFVTKQSIAISSPVVPSEAQVLNNTAGNEFPNIDLAIDSRKIPTISFMGKPTVFTFLSTWSPYAPQQLSSIKELSGNSQINVVPIVSQESSTSVSVFSKRGGYSFPIFSDPDGLLVKPLGLSFFPTSVFVDRKGIVKSVKVGTLTKDELLENMIY